jgi:hypothetical protein
LLKEHDARGEGGRVEFERMRVEPEQEWRSNETLAGGVCMSPSKLSSAFEVKRRIPLGSVTPGQIRVGLAQRGAIEPIREAQAEAAGTLRLHYGASCIGLRDIERLLDEAGLARQTTVRWRMREACYRFLNANVRSNALSGGGACGDRPPSPWRTPSRDPRDPREQ